jgi:sodium/potassium/calcium exchanger 6
MRAVMALSACFAGPMLNILFGVGASGIYLVTRDGGQPYKVDMSPTLFVSGFGLIAVLVATLIVVPLRGFWLGRAWGSVLIGAYVVMMAVNIAVEVRWVVFFFLSLVDVRRYVT